MKTPDIILICSWNCIILNVICKKKSISGNRFNTNIGLNRIQLNESKNQLFAVIPKQKRTEKAKICALALNDNGSCITMESTDTDATSISFLADYKYVNKICLSNTVHIFMLSRPNTMDGKVHSVLKGLNCIVWIYSLNDTVLRLGT